MAISTQTEALLDLYNQKVSLDTQQLSQINVVQNGYTIQTGVGPTEKIKIWGPTEVIENYNVPIEKLDNRIIEINNQITNLQSQILSVGQEANSVGCGTTGIFLFSPLGFSTVTVYQDQLRYRGYTFTAPNPFSGIDGTLITSNSGIGTQDYIAQVSIGVYYGPIGTNGVCAGYATSITNLTNSINVLRSERDPLIEKSTFLKEGRSQYELQNYAYNQSIVRTNESISNSNTIISFLEDPQNAEWL